MIWFPEIFERFHSFEINYPKTTATVCDISKFNSTSASDKFEACDASIEDRVFLDTVIIALSCIPTSVCLGIAMKTFGKRTVLSMYHIVIRYLHIILRNLTTKGKLDSYDITRVSVCLSNRLS